MAAPAVFFTELPVRIVAHFLIELLFLSVEA